MTLNGSPAREALVIASDETVRRHAALILNDEYYLVRTADTLSGAMAALIDAPAAVVLLGEVDDRQVAPRFISSLEASQCGHVVLYSISHDAPTVESQSDIVEVRQVGSQVIKVIEDYEASL